MVCVIRLLKLLKTGVGVFDDAIPAPNAGCRMNSGARTVTIPTKRAGGSVGDRAHCRPKMASKRAAKVMPIE